VVDAFDPNPPLIVINPVDDAIAAAPRRVPASEFEMKWSSDTVWAVSQRSVNELGDGGDDLLRQP